MPTPTEAIACPKCAKTKATFVHKAVDAGIGAAQGNAWTLYKCPDCTHNWTVREPLPTGLLGLPRRPVKP